MHCHSVKMRQGTLDLPQFDIQDRVGLTKFVGLPSHYAISLSSCHSLRTRRMQTTRNINKCQLSGGRLFLRQTVRLLAQVV